MAEYSLFNIARSQVMLLSGTSFSQIILKYFFMFYSITFFYL